MYKSNNGEDSVRPADFKIVFDSAAGDHFVYPDATKGMSFSSNLQRLREIPIPGRIWLLPRSRQRPDLSKLKELEALMKDAGVKV